jgi:hypothetical protein
MTHYISYIPKSIDRMIMIHFRHIVLYPIYHARCKRHDVPLLRPKLPMPFKLAQIVNIACDK